MKLVDEDLDGESFDAEQAARGLSAADAAAPAARRKGTKRPQPGWEALTPTERKIAALVAEGLTNIECARELGIAATTVKAHLRHVFAKLDLKTRTALAAHVHRLERGPDGLGPRRPGSITSSDSVPNIYAK